MTSNPLATHRRQRGAVLLVGMVMLLMLMLVAVGVIRLSMRHTQVVNNEQLRTEAVAAANYALDLALNTTADLWDPYKGTTGKTELINLGVKAAADSTDVSMAVTVKNLECKRARIIKNAELIKTSGSISYVAPADTICFGGGGSPLTIVDTSTIGSPKDDSLCATVLYQMEAQVNDASLLGASVNMVQGVEVRRSVDELESCS